MENQLRQSRATQPTNWFPSLVEQLQNSSVRCRLIVNDQEGHWQLENQFEFNILVKCWKKW